MIKAKLLRHENMSLKDQLAQSPKPKIPCCLLPANKHDNGCLKSYLHELFAVLACLFSGTTKARQFWQKSTQQPSSTSSIYLTITYLIRTISITYGSFMNIGS